MTKTTKQKVYETGINEIRNSEFSGNFNVYEKPLSQGNFKANTHLISKEINFTYTPKVVQEKGEEKVLEVSKDAASHEINHHKYKNCIGCPQNVDKDHDLFFLPMYEILSKQGFSKEDVDYATNALEDSILHRDLKTNARKDLDGIVTFFEDVGENCENKKFTKFYEAHSKLNMDLWGAKSQKNKLNKFYTNDKKIKEVLDGFYSELAEGKLKVPLDVYTRSKCKIKKNLFGKKKRKFINREDKKIQIFDKEAIRKYVLDENNWKEISEAYAKHFSKLMEPNYALPTIDHSGAGTKGRESEDSSEQGNSFKQERNSKPFKKGKIMRANKSGEKAPGWINEMEVLDLVYEGLAEQIEIKAESYVNPESFPISWYGERPFNYERDKFKQIGFGIDESGEIELRKKTHSIDAQISVKTSPKSFPKIKFGMLDVSGSMEKDINGGGNIGNTSIIKWGNNSKYHWALMAQFGVFEYFKRNHLLTQDSISCATFGENTKIVEGYQKVKEKLLKPNFENSTQIEFNKIKPIFEGEGNLIYTISDGEIGNWNSIKEDFISQAKKHAYVHLHMGTKNEMTEDLRKAGLEVIIAKDGKGIMQKTIDLTDKLIRGGSD